MQIDTAITRNAISNEIFWHRTQTLIPYEQARTEMAETVAAIRAETAPSQVWLLEHPPLFTAGTSANPADLFNPHNYPTYNAGRGGQWTYHGPGQRIAYIMLDLNQPHGPLPARDVRAYVATLETWVIDALAHLGIESFLREGRIGVWTHDPQTKTEAKIAAIGVRISRWVTWHGLSINCAPNLADFDGIVPCGIREYGVTSLERLNPGLTMADLDNALIATWPTHFGSIPQLQDTTPAG